MEYIYIIIGIGIGLVVAYFLVAKQRTQIALLEQEKKHLEETAQKERTDAANYVMELEARHKEQLDEQRVQQKEQLQKTETQYQEALKQMNLQHEEQMRQQMTLIKAEMNTASERILKERAEQLSSANKEQLATILNPLQTHIQQMREATVSRR